ncbi:MAG: single-stranded DNA-binding protein [Eubacteriaceae bacterium]|nr:single-stranded DNA-binding protein [Eubacteriaceae bacterium]
MNKVVLIGRLTKDTEIRYTQQSTAVATFTVAINRRFKSKSGESETDFINVVIFGVLVENIGKYLLKGKQVAVSGRIQTRNYEANDGSRKYVTEVVGEEIELLGSGQGNTNSSPVPAFKQDNGIPMDDFRPMEDEDDDLPF